MKSQLQETNFALSVVGTILFCGSVNRLCEINCGTNPEHVSCQTFSQLGNSFGFKTVTFVVQCHDVPTRDRPDFFGQADTDEEKISGPLRGLSVKEKMQSLADMDTNSDRMPGLANNTQSTGSSSEDSSSSQASQEENDE